MRLDGAYILLAFFLAFCKDVIIGEVLDSGTLYVPIRSSFHLKCQNKIEGRFDSLVWISSAYSKGKHAVYTYHREKKREVVYPTFLGRLKRYDGTSIHIHNAQPEDSGNWECNILFYYKLFNEERRKVSVLAVYDVVVVSPPTISRVFPELVASISGYQASTFCDAHGLSPFNLTWVKVKGKISRYVSFNEEEGMKGKYHSKRSHMRFEKLSPKDVGGYFCVAENMAGRVIRSIKVKIQVRPKISSKKDFTAHEGEDAMLLCNATGFPKVNFEWKFMSNLEYITLLSGETRGKFSLSKTSYTSNGGTMYGISRLYIHNVRKEDWGIYKCNVESDIGWDRKDIKLLGYSLPSPPKIIPRKRVYTNQVDLKWELRDDGGSPIHSITVQYKSNLNMDWSTIQISKPLSQYTLINLQPNSIYDFRVLSTNSVGDSEYSDVIQVQTSTKEKEVVRQKQTIGDLGIISFIGVCGAALVGLTCAVGCICLYFQEKRINRYQVSRQDSREAGFQSSVNNFN